MAIFCCSRGHLPRFLVVTLAFVLFHFVTLYPSTLLFLSTTTATTGTNSIGDSGVEIDGAATITTKSIYNLERLRNHSTLQCQEDDEDLPIRGPSVMIIGAMKCGTTALEEIISQNYPHAIRTIDQEAHYFDHLKRKQQTPLLAMSNQQACEMRRDYLESSYNMREIADAIRQHSSLSSLGERKDDEPILIFEKTPSYIRIPGTAATVHRLFSGEQNADNFKVIALLRDPVARLYSEFLYLNLRRSEKRQKLWLPTTFDVLIERGMESLWSANLTLAPTLEAYSRASVERQQNNHNDTTSIHDSPNSSASSWRDFDLSFPDHLERAAQLQNPGISLYKSMYAPQVWEWMQYFTLGSNLMIVPFERLQANKRGTFTSIMEFLGLPVDFVDNLSDEVFEQNYKRSTNTGHNEFMSNSTEEYLRRLYKPYNDDLADLLGEEWRGIWD